MRLSLMRLFIVTALALIFAQGCATAPYTGRNQLLLLSSAQEMQLGMQAAQEVLSEERLSRDPQYVNAVQEVGWNIARVANEPSFQWEFFVVDDPETANASCLPGGKVFVYSGIFRYARNADQLAAVIAHEVAHAVARHGGERISNMLVLQLGQQAALAAIGQNSSTASQALQVAYGLGANVGYILPFSREQEYEADRIGLILMAQAGYHPQASLDFWIGMSREADPNRPPEFLSTHPTSENRIANIQYFLPEAMSYYRPRR